MASKTVTADASDAKTDVKTQDTAEDKPAASRSSRKTTAKSDTADTAANDASTTVKKRATRKGTSTANAVTSTSQKVEIQDDASLTSRNARTKSGKKRALSDQSEDKEDKEEDKPKSKKAKKSTDASTDDSAETSNDAKMVGFSIITRWTFQTDFPRLLFLNVERRLLTRFQTTLASKRKLISVLILISTRSFSSGLRVFRRWNMGCNAQSDKHWEERQ